MPTITSYINKARKIQGMRSDKIMQKHLLWVMLLRTILYTMLLLLSYFLEDASTKAHIPQGILIILVSTAHAISIFSALYLLIFQDNTQKFGLNQVLFDSILTSLLVFFTGTSLSHFTIVYFFPIITAGLILHRRQALVAAAATTMQLGLLLFLQTKEVFPLYLKDYMTPYPLSISMGFNLFATHGLLFFLTALLSILFGHRLRRAETALSASLQKLDALSLLYKKIFDNISTGILTIDSSQRINSANAALSKILNISNHNLLGRSLVDIFPQIQLKTENQRHTLNFQKEDGEILRIGYSCMFFKQEQQEKSAEMIITMRDITELENLERQVRQAEKLAAIGTMSASIAHDFRNPLTAISGSAQVLAAEFSKTPEQHSANQKLVDIILRESSRLTESIGDFLKFARPESLQPGWITLGECLGEGIHMLTAGGGLPATVQITRDFPENLAVWADEKQLFTLLTHLIQNAIPFCPPGEERISIQAREETRAGKGKAAGLWLTLIVADNGSGIAEDPPETVFEPFHTTRTNGTGLGLAIVQQIVSEHQGTITVDNKGLPNTEERHGARFTINLPLPEQEEEFNS